MKTLSILLFSPSTSPANKRKLEISVKNIPPLISDNNPLLVNLMTVFLNRDLAWGTVSLWRENKVPPISRAKKKKGANNCRRGNPQGLQGHNLQILRATANSVEGRDEHPEGNRRGQKGQGNVAHQPDDQLPLHPLLDHDSNDAKKLKSHQKNHKECGRAQEGGNERSDQIPPVQCQHVT